MLRSTPFSVLSRLALAGLIACGGGGGATDADDKTPPAIVSASSDGSSVTVIFSEEVSAATIRKEAFAITPGDHPPTGVTIIGGRQVKLAVFLPGAPPTAYTLTATGIDDLAGNVASVLTTTFSFGRTAPVVGAAYLLPDGLSALLINGDGTRFSIYDLRKSPNFTASQPVSALPQAGIPFPIGASATRFNRSLTYYWGIDGDAYIGYDHAKGSVSPATQGSFKTLFPECALTGGVGAAFALGNLSSSPDRIFLFSADGTQTRVWSYAVSGAQCGALASFSEDFGGGGSPISAVGAGFYRGGFYYLFDKSGTTWTIYSGSGSFSRAQSTADLGDRKLSF